MNTTRAAIYARISSDDAGLGLGVERQLAECRALANARGWEVVGEHVDNGVSATTGKARPGYQAVMTLASSRRISQIICWQSSRLVRTRKERAEAIGVLQEARVGIACVMGQDLDMTTAAGRAMAGLLGEFDTLEGETKGERVRSAAAQRARAGNANGACAYGWRRERDASGFRDVVEPETAAIVVEIVDRLLSGESLRGITADFNTRQVPAPRASAWSKTAVKKLAIRPGNVALRIYHQGQPDEELIPAAWPPIVAQDKHDQVVALLTDPSRAQERPGRRVHLLTSGIGVCGVCGGVLRHVKRRGRPLYACQTSDCVARLQDKVDELVAAVVVARLSQPDALAWLEGDDTAATAAREHAEALRARLDTAADQYSEGVIDARQLARITAKLRPLIESAEAEQRACQPREHASIEAIAGPAARSAWEGLGVAQKRSVLAVLGVSVVIKRTPKGRVPFDPRGVEIRWQPIAA